MRDVNVVLEGRYKGEKIGYSSKQVVIHWSIDKTVISSYTVIDETNKDQYSFWKGALGVALFGGIGAIAGLKGKKSKEYLVAIQWKRTGEKSLICIDEDCYKTLVKIMF
jgi:hypothetical protein|nr:MAG TPA: capsid protein [Caudoviricetes sp.]